MLFLLLLGQLFTNEKESCCAPNQHVFNFVCWFVGFSGYPCNLFCQLNGNSPVDYGIVTDGTRCSNQPWPEIYDVCITGKCRVSMYWPCSSVSLYSWSFHPWFPSPWTLSPGFFVSALFVSVLCLFVCLSVSLFVCLFVFLIPALLLSCAILPTSFHPWSLSPCLLLADLFLLGSLSLLSLSLFYVCLFVCLFTFPSLLYSSFQCHSSYVSGLWSLVSLCLDVFISGLFISCRLIAYFQAVGCDHQLESGQQLDRCAVCSGDGQSCRRIQSAYTKNHLQWGTFLIH